MRITLKKIPAIDESADFVQYSEPTRLEQNEEVSWPTDGPTNESGRVWAGIAILVSIGIVGLLFWWQAGQPQ